MSQWGVQRQKSTLSGIPEQLVLNSTIYLLLIGPNAWKLTNEFCKASQQEFQAEGDRMHGFQSTKERKKNSSGINYLSDHPPVSCTVLVPNPEDPEMPRSPRNGEGSQGLDSSGEMGTPRARPPANNRASGQNARGSARVSATGRPRSSTLRSSGGRRSMLDLIPAMRRTRQSEQCTEYQFDQYDNHQAVKVYCFPVEKFSESVPHCRTVEQWRAMCMVFLMDSRQTEMGDPIKELHGRLEEVRRWVGNFIQASDVKSAPAQLQVVFQHKGDNDPAESNEKEMAFVGKVRELARAPQSEVIHHFCNFDDSACFMKRVVKVLTNLIETRQGEDYDFQPEFMDMLYERDQEARAAGLDDPQQRACCTAM